MSIHQESPFITWVLDVLSDGGLTVGDAQAPSTVPAGSGYCVVYSLPGGLTTGSLEAPRSDAEAGVQVTSSDVGPVQARWLADKVRTLLNAAVPATLTGGRKVIWLDFDMGNPAVYRNDRVQPARFEGVDRFTMGTA